MESLSGDSAGETMAGNGLERRRATEGRPGLAKPAGAVFGGGGKMTTALDGVGGAIGKIERALPQACIMDEIFVRQHQGLPQAAGRRHYTTTG